MFEFDTLQDIWEFYGPHFNAPSTKLFLYVSPHWNGSEVVYNVTTNIVHPHDDTDEHASEVGTHTFRPEANFSTLKDALEAYEGKLHYSTYPVNHYDEEGIEIRVAGAEGESSYQVQKIV